MPLSSRVIIYFSIALFGCSTASVYRPRPDDSRKELRKGLAIRETGDLKEADKQIRKAIRYDSSNTKAYLAMARLYLPDRPLEAAPILSRGLSHKPNNDTLTYWLALCQVQTGQFNRAAAGFERLPLSSVWYERGQLQRARMVSSGGEILKAVQILDSLHGKQGWSTETESFYLDLKAAFAARFPEESFLNDNLNRIKRGLRLIRRDLAFLVFYYYRPVRSPNLDTSSFGDLQSSDPYYESCIWAVNHNILETLPDANFHPDYELSRLNLSLIRVCLSLFVERHHDNGCSVFPDALGFRKKIVFAFLETDRVYDTLPLKTLKTGFNDFPL